MKKLVVIAISAICVAAIALGLLVAGGPGYARMQNNDRDRATDLQAIERNLFCREGVAPETLPEAGAIHCDGLYDVSGDLTDPVTGEPYRYERIDDQTYRLCAVFETDAEYQRSVLRGSHFDPATGCLTGKINNR